MKDILNTPTQSDVFSFLDRVPDQTIQTCITSPPYYGLRNYKIPDRIWDEDPDCEHSFEGDYGPPTKAGHQDAYTDLKWKAVRNQMNKIGYTQFCSKCWAWKGTLGAEPFPGLFIDHLVSVFMALWPKLHDTGTLWVNLGDSYAGSGGSWGITKDTPSVAARGGKANMHHPRGDRNPTTKGPNMDFFKPLGLLRLPCGTQAGTCAKI